ncbi:MAG: hypothetical protein RBG13Loki_1763 [Promethearchaeota archaeon CR_4]|nr:MAG: hypothetical protein RBG13Loki_1763 [Candidatus Lokiarchaeota archaeon CR_4]
MWRVRGCGDSLPHPIFLFGGENFNMKSTKAFAALIFLTGVISMLGIVLFTSYRQETHTQLLSTGS